MAAARVVASSLRAEGQETILSSLALQGVPPGPWECRVWETGSGGHRGWNRASREVQVTHTPYFALLRPSQTYLTPIMPKKMGWHER